MVKVKSDYMVKLKGDKEAHNNKRGRGTEVGVFANLSVIHSKNFCRVLITAFGFLFMLSNCWLWFSYGGRAFYLYLR